MPRQYKCLTQQEYHQDNYSIVPIRDEDKYDIMKWWNDFLLTKIHLGNLEAFAIVHRMTNTLKNT